MLLLSYAACAHALLEGGGAVLLQGSDLLVVVADLAADDPQVRENLLSAQQKIQSAAEEITSRLDSAEEALRNNLCSSDINLFRLRQKDNN